MRRPPTRSLAGGAAGIVVGISTGVALSSIPAAVGPPGGAPVALEGAHLPPVLTLPGEPVRLRYAIVCAPRDDGEPCHGSGDVYARAGESGPFQRFALRRGAESSEGRYVVDLPQELASSRSGFSYYAVLRDDAGDTTTLPSGGASAPQHSFPLRDAVEVDLGAHVFGRLRSRDARVLSARWGSSASEVGLAGSRELGFEGPGSFDVDAGGTVTVLDQVNHRVQRWSDRGVESIAVAVGGGLADLAVEPDGAIDILEPPDRMTPVAVLRSFRRDGSERWTQRLADRTWSKLDSGPDGPVVQQEPSEQWLPAAVEGSPLPRSAQAAHGRSGKPVGHGHQLIVERTGVGELRLADVVSSAVVRSWRIRSATPLGEVQLAELQGSRLVVVVKAYTDERDEFLVLVLGHAGLVERFSVEPFQWAESAPLARFRLAGRSLYQLGSTPSGAFVDRFDLEVSR